ncbi:MAG: DUF1761 domain-containing protein [Hyphomicrobiaceae bacterium]|nr:DUF1761 domain-containing protein [Hyphomicrobiaceae bacterium]
MSFAGINYLAVFVAAIAGFMVGGVWYGALFGERWMKAAGLSNEQVKGGSPLSFVVAGLADFLMAWMLAGVIGHTAGEISLVKGLLVALFVWLGFVLTTNGVNNSFQMRPLALTIIDAGHWLVVLLVMGAVVGLFGV